ncbi:hypothetical protein ES705_19157 [subsurface metagenome]
MIVALTVLLSILCGCIDYEVETPVSTPTSTPTLSTSTPTPTLTMPTLTPTPMITEEEKNTEIVIGIVEAYYKTHTYSKYDLFVCADMAIDVWNMVETQGINAEIAVGNVDNSNADWTEYYHAWVLAEVSLDTWLALEATGGYVTYDENYYRGYFFKNPRAFKEYLELMKEYNAQIDRIKELQVEYSDTYNEWVKEYNYYKPLSDDYNSNCAGTTSDPSKVQECMNKNAKLNQQKVVLSKINGELEQISDTINEENKRLTEITNELNELLT